MKKPKFTLLQWAAHIGAWLPAAWLAYHAWANLLGANPIQAAEQFTGKTALVLLVLSFSCTPASSIFRFRQAIPLRRPFGVYGFLYALTHFSIFLGIDYGFNLGFIWADTRTKPYIYAGLTALLMLAPLAITSTKWSMRKMGKRWKKLHRLVYIALPVVILHYSWVIKGSLARLSGNILPPLAFGLLVALLLLMRLRPVQQPLARAWQKIRASRSIETPDSKRKADL